MKIYKPFLKFLTMSKKIILFPDFEKAFDSINHDYLFKSLKHFNILTSARIL